MKKALVLIAQAHGRNTAGKRSPDGEFLEYRWSREITKMIVEGLHKNGIKTAIVNPEEEEVHLSTQAKRANDLYKKYRGTYDEIILISPHVNAGPKSEWSKANGWCGYVYTKAGEKSRKLVKAIAHYAYDVYGLKGDRWVPKEGYHTQNLAICRMTAMPAVLTENMFMTNKDDVAFLNSKEGKSAIVDVHVKGIIDYLSD